MPFLSQHIRGIEVSLHDSDVTMEEFNRIPSIWGKLQHPAHKRGRIKPRSEIAVTKNGEPFVGFERKVIGDGIIELAFAEPAGPGIYQVGITPKIATGSGSLTGTTYSAVIQMN